MSAQSNIIDLRTKAGRRAEIISQVKKFGGFSVFWITENHLRAIVGTEMLKRGELVESKKSEYPWHVLKIGNKTSSRKK